MQIHPEHEFSLSPHLPSWTAPPLITYNQHDDTLISSLTLSQW